MLMRRARGFSVIEMMIAFVLLAAAAAVILADGFHIASHWHSILVTCAGNSACLQQQAPLVNGVLSDLPYISLLVPAVLRVVKGEFPEDARA